jgi:hypothetical protein
MAETVLELRAILDAAERAAAAENFVSAEQHLRQAALLQEQQVGAGHPDLANTLNNLGIVCEYVGKPADAEASYRRAYRIASATLPADHPLVQTSGKNLRDFCEAIGKPLDLPETVPPELEPFAPEPVIAEPRPKLSAVPPSPPAPPAPVAPAPIVAPAPVAQAPAAPAKQPPAKQPPATQPPTAKAPAASAAPSLVIRDLPLRSPDDTGPQTPARAETATIRISSPVSPSSSRPTMAIASGVVVIVAAATWWFGFREASEPSTPASPPVETVAPRQEQAAPPEEQATPRVEPPPLIGTTAPEAPAVPEPIEKPPIAEAPAKPTPPLPSASGGVSVVDAKLCRSLSTSNWTCTAATSPVAPGTFFYYTRVRSPRDTTVQHRWYMDGRLLRSVSLRIGANAGAGYRTYSRNTVSAERRGTWTIELRGADGALLHEERFTVQ